MKNYVQRGEVVTATAPSGGIVSGVGLQVGSLFGVAAYDADAAAEVEIQTVGVFDLAKADGAEFAAGDVVYWDATEKVVDDGSTGNQRIGVALAAAAGAATTARVRLDGAVF